MLTFTVLANCHQTSPTTTSCYFSKFQRQKLLCEYQEVESDLLRIRRMCLRVVFSWIFRGGFVPDLFIFVGVSQPVPVKRVFLFFSSRYLLHVLDQYVQNDYVLVYFHYGLNSENKLPLSWLAAAYKCFDRKWVEISASGSRSIFSAALTRYFSLTFFLKKFRCIFSFPGTKKI